MEMTMQSFLEKQKQMLKEDLSSLNKVKSKLKKTHDKVNTELCVQTAIRPPFGIDKNINAKISELRSLKAKIHSQLLVINKQITDIESAINNI